MDYGKSQRRRSVAPKTEGSKLGVYLPDETGRDGRFSHRDINDSTGLNAMTLGTIARLVGDKGFGFIRGDFPGDADVFFHASAVAGNFKTLYEGQRVRFDVQPSDRGPRAERVELVEG